MAESRLMLHCGARHVESDELALVKAPPPEGRWYPLSHISVLNRVKETLAEAGYAVIREQLALSRHDARFFGTIDLQSKIVQGVTLAAGVRNSIDRSLPIGFIAGTRTFVCDNLAFRSELLVKRKHTLNGERTFAQGIAQAVMSLNDFKETEGARIEKMRDRELKPEQADSLILQSFERGIITAPALPRVIKEWKESAYEEFQPRTMWSLYNAFTNALRERAVKQPTTFAVQTMRLGSFLDAAQFVRFPDESMYFLPS
jgi:hypothetical protein